MGETVLPRAIPLHLDRSAIRVEEVAGAWLKNLSDIIPSNNWRTELPFLFSEMPQPWWKDQLSLTWDLRSLYTLPKILDMIEHSRAVHRPRDFQLIPLSSVLLENGPIGFIQSAFTFKTNVASCSALLRLIYDDDTDSWKAWVVFTRIENLTSFEEHLERLSFPDVGAKIEPDVVIIGAGQCGLQLAATLRALGMKPLIVERESRVGDHWRKHYDSLRIHLPKWGSTFAYQNYPKEMPIYPSKDDLADFMENYVSSMNLSVLTSCQVEHARFDLEEKKWIITIVTIDGYQYTCQTLQLVIAIGVNGLQPVMPTICGQDQYNGTVMHSSQFTNASLWQGKNVIVVGAANTAHDITRDLVEGGALSTVMVQRGPTMVVSQQLAVKHLSTLYGPSAPPIQVADRIQESMPYTVAKHLFKHIFTKLANFDKDMVKNLGEVGFQVAEPVILDGYLERYGGTYINTGTSELITSGKIQVKSGVPIQCYTPNGLLFEDGEEMTADLVIFATGYDIKSLYKTANMLLDEDSRKLLREIWGLDNEGQLKVVWRNSGHPNLWFTGGITFPYSHFTTIKADNINANLAQTGNLPHARYYAKILALQIQAVHLSLKVEKYK